MKTLVKTLVCAAALSVASFSHATEKNVKTPKKSNTNFEASVYVAKDASIRVAIEKNEPSKVTINLRDSKNNAVYLEETDKNDLKTAYKFNVESLEDGYYTLEIVSEKRPLQNLCTLAQPKSRGWLWWSRESLTNVILGFRAKALFKSMPPALTLGVLECSVGLREIVNSISVHLINPINQRT